MSQRSAPCPISLHCSTPSVTTCRSSYTSTLCVTISRPWNTATAWLEGIASSMEPTTPLGNLLIWWLACWSRSLNVPMKSGISFIVGMPRGYFG